MAEGLDPAPRYARYPFLSGAREAVDRAGVDLGTVVETEPAVVKRATARVESAIADRTVGEPHRSPRVELLSYPVARVLVSLVDQTALRNRYAAAEAATAIERYWSDQGLADRRTAGRRPLELDELLQELAIIDDVRRIHSGSEPWRERRDAFRIDVTRYLRLASDLDGSHWRLTARRLRDGEIPVDGDEFEVLLREAIADHVAAGLPLPVPDEVSAALREASASVRAALSDLDVDVDIDTVVPGLFPPCMRALLSRAGSEESLPSHSRFSLVSFLLAVGLTPAEIVTLANIPPEEQAAYETMAERIGDEGPPQYPPPSCATMQTYGDCVNMDEVCERIDHPLEYYETRLAEAGPVSDWRDTRA